MHVNLRVEDSPDPVVELARLVRRKRLFDDVIAVLFADGLMIGPYREPKPGATATSSRPFSKPPPRRMASALRRAAGPGT